MNGKDSNVDEPLTSVLSAQSRGRYGNCKFPGNCSGIPIRQMFEYFEPKYVLDPMEGSGTCRDVCKELKISYDGFDIITGGNIFNINFEKKYDFIHWHPPYFKMNAQKYLELCNHHDNISKINNILQYTEKILICYDKLFAALVENGILAILCGLCKYHGKIYDMAYEFKKHDEKHFFFEFIKIQHGIDKKVLAGSTDFSKKYYVTGKYTLFGNKFIPVMHEKYILFKKDRSN